MIKEIRNNLDEEIDEVFFSINKDNLVDLEDLKKRTKKIKESYFVNDKEKYIQELILIRDKFYKH